MLPMEALALPRKLRVSHVDLVISKRIEQATQSRRVTKLPISVQIPNAGQSFAIGPQAEVKPAQQVGDRGRRQTNTASAQRLLNLAERAVRSLHAGDRVSRGRIRKLFFQNLQEVGTFFRARLASTGPANPQGWLGLAVLQFALPASNRVGIQAGDLCEEGDAPATVLLGEEADEEASSAFVGGSGEAVDPPVLPSPSAAGCC